MATLNWEITAAQRKKQVRRVIFMVGPTILVFAITFFLIYGRHADLQTITTGIFGIIIIFAVALLMNEVVPRKNRVYILNDNGITITKGKKTKHYTWHDFEYYFNYSARYGKGSSRIFGGSSLKNKTDAIFKKGEGIEGGIFYLKMKSQNIFSRFYKKFVVVYSELGNTGQVSGFLANHLERRKIDSAADLGIVVYEFK